MRPQLIRFFLLVWLGYTLFFTSTMPYLLGRSAAALLVRGVVTGLIVASLTTAYEWHRLRERARSAPPNEEL